LRLDHYFGPRYRFIELGPEEARFEALWLARARRSGVAVATTFLVPINA
jgi:hypothetical protein